MPVDLRPLMLRAAYEAAWAFVPLALAFWVGVPLAMVIYGAIIVSDLVVAGLITLVWRVLGYGR